MDTAEFFCRTQKERKPHLGLPLTDAVLSCVFAVMAAVSSGKDFADNILAVGAYLALWGMFRYRAGRIGNV